MKKFITLCLLLFELCSCSYKVFVNGTYSHKMPSYLDRQVPRGWCMVLEQNEKIPDSAIFVNTLKIAFSPFGLHLKFLSMAPNEYNLLNIARTDVEKNGENIVRINKAGNFFLKGPTLIVNTYRLGEPYLSHYRKFIDSVNRVTCLVHVKNEGGILNDMQIYFKDSLVGVLGSSILCKKRTGTSIQRLDFRVRGDGLLSLKVNATNGYRLGLPLKNGNTYYVVAGRYKNSQTGFLMAANRNYFF